MNQYERYVKHGSRGRTITVNNKKWLWKTGSGGSVVAYCETGEIKKSKAWDIKGIDPEIFYRGQYKKTTDGMLTPKDVSTWLNLP